MRPRLTLGDPLAGQELLDKTGIADDVDKVQLVARQRTEADAYLMSCIMSRRAKLRYWFASVSPLSG